MVRPSLRASPVSSSPRKDDAMRRTRTTSSPGRSPWRRSRPLATVLALPGGRRGRAGEAREHRRAADQRLRRRRLDALGDQRHLDGPADELRVPVGSLPAERRTPTARTARRSAAPRPRSTSSATADVDRRLRVRVTAANADGSADRGLERDRARSASRRGPAGERRGADAQRDPGAGQTLRVCPARGTAGSRSRSRSSGSAATPRATTASSSPASTTTPTSCARATSARRSARASSPATPRARRAG